MRLILIAAVARNRAIGLRNRLLYHLPEDLAHFRALTTGHTVIMGRATYESLPNGTLPDRRNIVLSRSLGALPGLGKEGERSATSLELYPSLEAALAHCAGEETVYVIGGAQLYAQAMAMADELCLTEIADTPREADAWFPDYSEWHEKRREEYPKTPLRPYAFAFVTYRR